MSAVDPDVRVNLSKANAVIIDGSQHSLDVMAQILKGFGVAIVTRFNSLEDATKYLSVKSADLLLIDPGIDGGAGYDFVISQRHGGGPNAFIPTILLCGHVRRADLERARNAGANFVVTKPISPAVLLQRVLWVARDKRPFVQIGEYIGPDRRFKFEGPPPGSDGRRSGDLDAEVGDAKEPNLSQDEVSALIKPQRVMI